MWGINGEQLPNRQSMSTGRELEASDDEIKTRSQCRRRLYAMILMEKDTLQVSALSNAI